MRLIDVDALTSELGLDFDTGESYDEKTLRDFIDNAPIIDAEPVRHGKWITISGPDRDGNILACCSECGHRETINERIHCRYCWFCGAKMHQDIALER